MNIADRIDGLLKQRGWTAYRLAQEADIPQSTLSNIFNRPYEPTVSTLEVICKGFDITMSEFFAGDDDEVMALTADQRDILKQWGKLTTEQRKILVDFLKTM